MTSASDSLCGSSPAPRSSIDAPRGADLLTIGFGAAVAMWAVGYVGRLPGVMLPGVVIASGMLAVLIAGGFIAGRSTGRGWRGGAMAGGITAALNLLIVLSLIRSDQTQHQPFSWWSVPGTMIGTAVVAALAASIGARFKIAGGKPAPAPGSSGRSGGINWTGRFAAVAACATLLLLLAGGLVTGREAGLAVPDWPRSFGVNMFLYPLARMTGNIYYEHTHRLYGALVGLTTITLAIHLWLTDRRGWLKALAMVAVLAVIGQGVMGGLRVALAESAASGTAVEIAQAEHETSASTMLRVAHGVFGQVFFGLMVALAAFTSTTWKRDQPPQAHDSGGVDRGLGVMLVVALLVQLLLGAMVRHLQQDVLLHVSMAAIVTILALVSGMRAWGMHGERHPLLKRLGVTLLLLVGLQLALGIAALIVVNMSADSAEPTVADVLVTTAHQINGAALLAVAVLLTAFCYRLLKPAARQSLALPETGGAHTSL